MSILWRPVSPLLRETEIPFVAPELDRARGTSLLALPCALLVGLLAAFHECSVEVLCSLTALTSDVLVLGALLQRANA